MKLIAIIFSFLLPMSACLPSDTQPSERSETGTDSEDSLPKSLEVDPADLEAVEERTEAACI